MKNIIFIIGIILIFFGGFFFGRKSGVNVLESNKISGFLSGGSNSGFTNVTSYIPITKEKFTKLCREYVVSGDSGELLKHNGIDIIRLIDNARALYPFSGSMLNLVQIPSEKRLDTLRGSLNNLKPNSMAYATISDYLNGTHLCESFPQKDQCKNQFEVLSIIMNEIKIPKKEISLITTSKIRLYSIQSGFSKEEYMGFIQDLTVEYCNSL